MTKAEAKAIKNAAKQQGGKNAPAIVETNVTENSNETESGTDDGEPAGEPAARLPQHVSEPIVSAPAKQLLAIRTPPKKNGKKGGGGKTKGAGEPEYNVAIVMYNDIVVRPKTSPAEYGILPHILTGNWVPTFNGDADAPVNEALPKFASMEEAIKAKAVEFGMKNSDQWVKENRTYGYAQNIQLKKAGMPLTGKTNTDGTPVLYSTFITATAKTVDAIVANIKAWNEHPSVAGTAQMIELLPAPYKLTYPQVAPATIGTAETKELETA